MIYLDNAATTAVLPEVAEVVTKYMCQVYGNPSSLHQYGVTAERALETSKKIIAKQLNCRPEKIIFTSGGTEGNNSVLLNSRFTLAQKSLHFITTQVEHASVLKCFEKLEKLGHTVSYLAPNGAGGIDASAVVAALRPNTALISMMLVNNELGAINPLRAITKALRDANYSGLVHSDAAQAVGKIAVDIQALGVDFLTASGHKFHAPKGVGLLIDNTNSGLSPLLIGGGQQQGRRSGTENVAGITGLAKAMQCVAQLQTEHLATAKQLKAGLYHLAEKLGTNKCLFLGDRDSSSPYITALALRGIKSEVLLHALESNGVLVSSGSACHSNAKSTISHVIAAHRVPAEFAEGVIRISASLLTTEAEVTQALNIIGQTIDDISRKLEV